MLVRAQHGGAECAGKSYQLGAEVWTRVTLHVYPRGWCAVRGGLLPGGLRVVRVGVAAVQPHVRGGGAEAGQARGQSDDTWHVTRGVRRCGCRASAGGGPVTRGRGRRGGARAPPSPRVRPQTRASGHSGEPGETGRPRPVSSRPGRWGAAGDTDSCDCICIKVRTRTRARQQEGGAACNQTAQEVTRATSHVTRDTLNTRVQVDVTDLEPRMLEPVAGGGLAVAGLSPWLAAIIAVLGAVNL